MAKIEKIEPGPEKLVTDVGAVPEKPELAMREVAAGSNAAMFIDIGNASKEIGDVLFRAHAAAEDTKFKNQFAITMDKAIQDMEEDPNYSEEMKAQRISELRQNRDNLINQITIPAVRKAAMRDTELDIELAGHKISKEYNKRMKQDQAANSTMLLNQYGHRYISRDMNDIAGREHDILKMYAEYDKNAAARFINPKQAATGKIETIKKWNEALLKYQAEINPEGTIAELEKQGGGAFSNIAPEIRAEKLAYARQQKNHKDEDVKATLRNLNHVTDEDMAWKFSHQALTQGELERNRKNMTSTRYETLTAKMANPAKYTAQDNPEEYSRMMDVLSDKTTTQRQFVDQLLEAKLSEAERLSLMELGTVSPDKDPVFKSSLSDTLEKKKIVQAWKDQMVDKKKQANSTVWEMLKKYTDNNKEKAAKLAMQIKETDADKLPQAAAKVIKQDAVKSNPHVAQARSQGIMMVDSKGNKALVFPDGTVEEQ